MKKPGKYSVSERGARHGMEYTFHILLARFSSIFLSSTYISLILASLPSHDFFYNVRYVLPKT